MGNGDLPGSLKEHARELYSIFVELSAPDYWDWQALANKAFDAAEHFETIATQRASRLNESIPTLEAPGTQVPGMPQPGTPPPTEPQLP
jgi:hypothetical protein